MPGEPARTARPARADGGRSPVGPDDVRRVLQDLNRAGLSRGNTALAPDLVRYAGDTALTQPDIGRMLPAPAAITGLLPWPGLRRGATVATIGSTSLLMALLASALSQGSWGACIGVPDFGALAAAEIGVPLERLALIPAPGPNWSTVVSAAIDGLDVVAVATPPGAAESTTRALMNRARQKGCVLLLANTTWPNCDLTIELTGRVWVGLGAGHGRLRHQQMTLRAVGRGRAVRPRTATVTMPAPAPELVIPPPAATAPAPPPGPAAADAGPWAGLEATEPPADPWTKLRATRPRSAPFGPPKA